MCFLGLPLGRLPLFRFCTSFSCSLKTISNQSHRLSFCHPGTPWFQTPPGSLAPVSLQKHILLINTSKAEVQTPLFALGVSIIFTSIYFIYLWVKSSHEIQVKLGKERFPVFSDSS